MSPQYLPILEMNLERCSVLALAQRMATVDLLEPPSTVVFPHEERQRMGCELQWSHRLCTVASFPMGMLAVAVAASMVESLRLQRRLSPMPVGTM